MFTRSQIRRRRAVLAVLTVASLALLTVWFGESAGGALHAIGRGAQEALSPIEEGTSRALKPVRDAIGWLGDVVDAKGENKHLKKEVQTLRGQLATAATDRRDAEELRGLVGLRRTLPAASRLVTGRVIAHSPTAWYSTIQIDKGRSDGVRVDDPVLAAGGLAGKVVDATGGTARVALLTDSTSAVSAEIMAQGASGIVRPEVGDQGDLLLDFIDKKTPVRRGDVVVTSGFRAGGLASLFPRGIPIGKVASVDRTSLDVYQTVHVAPYADLHRLDIVQVVTGFQRGAQAVASR